MKEIRKQNVYKSLLLTICTVGVYGLYWMWLLVKNMATIKGKESAHIGEYLCILLIPFYNAYWFYKNGAILDCEIQKVDPSRHINKKRLAVLAIFVLPMLSAALMQNDFNSLPSGTDVDEKICYNKSIEIISDLVLSIGGLIIMNGLMQLLINPKLQTWMGAESFGSFQSVIAVVAIMGTTFGVAANYSRMVQSREKKDANGDYNIYLAMAVALCLPVSIVTLIVYKSFSPAETALLFFLMAFTILRYYGDVYFRLHLDYSGYFIYYAIMTVGYCAGLGVYYLLFKNALLTMLLGELAAVVFVFITGNVFGGKRPFRRSEHFGETMKSVGILTGTDLITAITQQSDRIILRLTWGGAPVTVFYVSTLLGKVVSLLTTPLNGVMIGYLTKYEGRFTRKMYAVFTGAMLGLGVLATVGCFVASLLFVKLFYPDVFAEARPFFLLANMGQVFFFISNCMMTVLLRVASEKYQMYVNLIYLVVYAAVVIPMTWKLGISGLVWGLLIANVTKFAVVTLIGFARVGSGKETADGA